MAPAFGATKSIASLVVCNPVERAHRGSFIGIMMFRNSVLSGAPFARFANG